MSERTTADVSTYVPSMNIEPSITTELTDDKNPYPVVPDRLVRIDGVDFVRCDQHGLIPVLHRCGDSRQDHWCREAAHPNYDPADGDQMTSWDDWTTVQSAKVQRLADALLTACLYLDGFVWLDDPEASEMDDIKDTVASSLGCKNWTEAMDLARLREARRPVEHAEGAGS